MTSYDDTFSNKIIRLPTLIVEQTYDCVYTLSQVTVTNFR